MISKVYFADSIYTKKKALSFIYNFLFTLDKAQLPVHPPE